MAADALCLGAVDADLGAEADLGAVVGTLDSLPAAEAGLPDADDGLAPCPEAVLAPATLLAGEVTCLAGSPCRIVEPSFPAGALLKTGAVTCAACPAPVGSAFLAPGPSCGGYCACWPVSLLLPPGLDAIADNFTDGFVLAGGAVLDTVLDLEMSSCFGASPRLPACFGFVRCGMREILLSVPCRPPLSLSILCCRPAPWWSLFKYPEGPHTRDKKGGTQSARQASDSTETLSQQPGSIVSKAYGLRNHKLGKLKARANSPTPPPLAPEKRATARTAT